MEYKDATVVEMGSNSIRLLDSRTERLAEKSEKSHSLLPVKRQIRRAICFSGCSSSVPVRLWLKNLFLLLCGNKMPTRCNKYHLLHLVGILFPHNNDDARSKSLQILSFTLVRPKNAGSLSQIRIWQLPSIPFPNQQSPCHSKTYSLN